MKKEKNFFLDVLSTIAKYFLIFVCVLMVYLMCSGIRIVKTGDVAIVLRFGKLVGDTYEEQVHKPGLLFAFPNFIDEVIIIPANKVMEQTVDTYYTSPDGITGWDGGYLLTGDQSVAVVSASVKYVVSDPVNYATHVKDIQGIVNAAVSTAMLNEASSRSVDDLLTAGKEKYGNDVKIFAMEKITKLELGIDITSLELTQVAMPSEVKYIYDELNAATVKAETIKEQAELNRRQQLIEAYARCDSMVANAIEETSRLKGDANTELAEFWGCVEEYRQAKDIVEARIFSKKVVEAMNKMKEIRIVDDDNTLIIIP